MNTVIGKTVIFLMLYGQGLISYVIARKLFRFTITEALLVAVFTAVCMIGSWHP